MSNELYHYGVKGMKWGVRRYQNRDGSLTAEGRKHFKTYSSYVRERDKEKRKAIKKNDPEGYKAGKKIANKVVYPAQSEYSRKVVRKYDKIHNAAADIADAKTKELNKRYEGVDFKKDRKAYRRYVNEYVEMWDNTLVSELKKQVGDVPYKETVSDQSRDSVYGWTLPTYISQKNVDDLIDDFYS